MNKKKSKKEEFRDLCLQKLRENRIELPASTTIINEKLPYEATLIECSREFPHLEYIIKNAISKLPIDKFSFSVVCTQKNYDFIKCKIINNINFPITIHKVPYDINTVNDYNNLLLNVDFWKIFREKEKILVMQEDTFIFKKNINDFLQYDNIGAPWGYTVVRNYPVYVGNGGFCLRSTKLIEESFEKKEEIMKELKKYQKPSYYSKQITNFPEDVFFSFAVNYLKNFKVPTIEIAKTFSTENIVAKNSFGGHQFWNQDKMWIERME